MRLRQKLFTAILGAMALMFLLLSLASFLNGLEAQRSQRMLEKRLESIAERAFLSALTSPKKDRWQRLTSSLRSPDGMDWEVTEEGHPLLRPERGDLDSLIVVAKHGRHALLRAREFTGLEPVEWLSTIFWALASGTAMLLLIVYGLLLRLVLRPIEDLAAASRILQAGGHPLRVPGDSRSDEMGDLIGAFNKMADEVVEHREDLKRRVDEATHEREKALKRLALEQRLSSTGKLAAGVAHEINNPLGGMMNAARSLSKEEGLSPRATEYVALVEDGLRRVADIVNRMRSFIRASTAVKNLEVPEMVRRAISFAQHRIDKESVELVEDYSAERNTVAGDIGELQQVLLNLLLNALDAMSEAEESKLRVAVSNSPDGESVVIEVSDTGEGMSEEQLASAFDLFYSTKESGTGLGLAIAHKIITDHEGQMEVDSSKGEGTTMRITLPCASTEE